MPAATASRASASPTFASTAELREVLDTFLAALDRDPDVAPRLCGAAGPLCLEFPDRGLVVAISRVEPGRLGWEYPDEAPATAQLTLSMESGFANRLMQGRENPAIAIARRRLRTTVEDSGAALRFFGAARPLFRCYRRVITEHYPHLAID